MHWLDLIKNISDPEIDIGLTRNNIIKYFQENGTLNQWREMTRREREKIEIE
jgi:hypothetical protein